MILRALIVWVLAFAGCGCGVYYGLGIRFLYDAASLPANQILRDIPYDSSAPDDPKRRLDLFLPAVRGFSTVVFIHGGGWTDGDRAYRVGGADVYGNIGRFLAASGFGAAVVSYRLLPAVSWRTQAADVARAVAWVQRRIEIHGGRPGATFLMGHSAGAQIAIRLAAESRWLESADGDRSRVCGVIAASGAGYDMVDEETYALGNDPQYYARRFSGSPPADDWRREASPAFAIGPAFPPALVLFAEGDSKPLQRQSRLLHRRLEQRGVRTRLAVVPGSSHERMVLELSSPHKTAGPQVLAFLRDTDCDTR